MNPKDQILDYDNTGNESYMETQPIMSESKFIFLCIISFGAYEVWWMYKAWRFFQRIGSEDIMPAARALFSVFFLHSLFTKILALAKEKGDESEYAPTSLFIGFFVANVLSKLPDPFWLISLFSFIFILPAFRALNFAKMNATEFNTEEETTYSGRQVALIVFGSLFWAMVLFGLFFEDALSSVAI